jgi:hypothetical protein
MRTPRAILRLSGADRRLLVEACVTVVAVRIGLRTVDIGKLRRWAARRGTGSAPVDRIVWATGAVCRRVPGATCLVYSLALQHLLSRHGQASELHIGVAKRDGAFSAHAWIVCAGRRFDGQGNDDAYAKLVAWRAADSG